MTKSRTASRRLRRQRQAAAAAAAATAAVSPAESNRPNYAMRYESLLEAVACAYKSLEPSRSLYRAAVKEYAGPGYGADMGWAPDKPLNKLQQAAIASVMMVGTNNPQASFSPKRDKNLEASASLFETTFNSHMAEIGIKTTFQWWLLHSCFGPGIIRCHMANSPMVDLEVDLDADPGQPFASIVQFDDFVWDVAATTWGTCKFVGNMWRMPYDLFLQGVENGMFDEKAAAKVRPSSKFGSDDPDRLEKIGRGEEFDKDDYQPMVDLADVWCAATRSILLFPVKDRSKMECTPDLLAEIGWGFRLNPYRVLGAADVPGSLRPIGQAERLMPLDNGINRQVRKSMRQGDRQKTIVLYKRSAQKTAQAIKNARDGEIIEGDPSEVKVISFGGVDPAGQLWLQNLLQLFDDQANNLSARTGSMAAQAPTATQQELMVGASSRIDKYMHDRFVSGMRDVFTTLAWLMHNDDVNTYYGWQSVPGLQDEYGVYRSMGPEDRQAFGFSEIDIDVNVFSMENLSPDELMQNINQLVGGFYAPNQQAMAQQGTFINFAYLSQLHAKGLRFPGFTNIIQSAGAPEIAQQQSMGDGPLKPPTSVRHQVRHNVTPGGGQGGLMQQLASMASARQIAGAEQ